MLSLLVARNVLDVVQAAIRPATIVPVRNKRSKKRLYWPTDWLPFTWEFPEKPIAIFNTGDPEERLDTRVKPDQVFKKGYEFLEERNDVPDSVKFLFRLSNSRRREITSYINEDRTAGLRRHQFDTDSHEYRIAYYTSRIRHLKEVVKHELPNDVRSKVRINNTMGKRNRFLNQLYRMNRERYYAVVNELKIDHKTTVPGLAQNPRLFRKGVLRSMTAEYCEKIRKERLEAYHEELKQQQPAFEKEKKETLAWIDEMKEKYQITEQDLDTEYRGRLLFNDPPKPRKKAV